MHGTPAKLHLFMSVRYSYPDLTVTIVTKTITTHPFFHGGGDVSPGDYLQGRAVEIVLLSLVAMADDGGLSMNDLPKVTKIVASEPISRAEAFDFLMRFLNANAPNRSSSTNAGPDMEERNEGAWSSIHHCWDDLFRVTETLASSPDSQEALRNLRLGVTFQDRGETRKSSPATKDDASPPPERTERRTVVGSADVVDESTKKRSKKEKREKKEKKRKRER